MCDSVLNGMKTRIYSVQNPIGESTWLLYCRFDDPTSLERAFAYIQTVMAVFDYYQDNNVKARHRSAYQSVMREMLRFELAYDAQYSTHIWSQWQERWYEFMTLHFMRVRTHTRLWLQNKLADLLSIWHAAVLLCAGIDSDYCGYCIAGEWLILQYIAAIDSKIDFDFTIFHI